MGKRGPKKGARYRPRFRLSADGQPERAPRLTQAERHAELKRRVTLLAADGLSAETIADVLQLDVDKLRMLFEFELKNGPELVRLEALARLDAASADGSVSASRALADLSALNAARAKHSDPTPEEPLAPAPISRLGKKVERAMKAAEGATGTSWEKLFPPDEWRKPIQ